VTVSVYSRNPFRRDYCMGKVFINPENAGHGMPYADVPRPPPPPPPPPRPPRGGGPQIAGPQYIFII
jgi:hypothetical protein